MTDGVLSLPKGGSSMALTVKVPVRGTRESAALVLMSTGKYLDSEHQDSFTGMVVNLPSVMGIMVWLTFFFCSLFPGLSMPVAQRCPFFPKY